VFEIHVIPERELKKGPTMPWWKEEGLRYANNHEPLCFRLRKGKVGVPEEVISTYDSEHTEDAVAHLRRNHVNTIFVHFFKGDSWTRDIEDRAGAKKLLRLAREAGIHPCVYIQGGSLSAETFLQERPEARQWCQVRADGTPAIYTGTQYQRFVPCLSNPDYAEFLKEVIRTAVEEADIDGYYLDNYLAFQQDTCYCECCKRGFHDFLAQIYRNPEERRLRYGFTDLSCLDFPVPPIAFNAFSSVTDGNRGPGRLTDPLLQDWLRYRLFVCRTWLREIYDFTKQLKNECAVGTNSGFGMSLNCELCFGTDRFEIGRIADFTWCETSRDWAAMSPKGAVVTRVRAYKLARTCDVEVLTCNNPGRPEERALELAQLMAFNRRTLTHLVRVTPAAPDLLSVEHSYLDWREKHMDLFRDNETLAEVAVLRSQWSLTYDYSASYLPVALFEQSLFQGKVPFDIITDRELECLKKYHALVLCETTCLSNKQIRLAFDFVRMGGGLVLVGEAGTRDEFCRSRTQSPWQEMFGNGVVFGSDILQVKAGSGRAVHVPAVAAREVMPEIRDTYWPPHITHDYLRLPYNHDALVQATAYAAGGKFCFSVKAPDYVAAEFLEQAEGRILIHLVNYNIDRDVDHPSVDVVGADLRGCNAEWFSPDGDRYESIGAVSLADRDRFTVPLLHRYGIMVLSRETAGPQRTSGSSR